MIGLSWYAVYTGIRAEKRASECIGALGIKTFCPLYEHYIRHGNRRPRKVERPLLARYLFAQFDAGRDRWGQILLADGVEAILSSRNTNQNGDQVLCPVPIPDRQMARIMAWEEHPDIIAAAKVGDIMRIIGGPFSGHVTTLTAVWPEKFKAKGEVMLFDRPTPVEFDLEQLEQQ